MLTARCEAALLAVVPWSPVGYGEPIDRPESGDATVLTPPSTVAVLCHGYRPVVHPTAS